MPLVASAPVRFNFSSLTRHVLAHTCPLPCLVLYTPQATRDDRFRIDLMTANGTTYEVFGLVGDGAPSTSILIFPAGPSNSTWVVLLALSGSVIKVTSTVSSPAVAKASVATTLLFLGYSVAA